MSWCSTSYQFTMPCTRATVVQRGPTHVPLPTSTAKQTVPVGWAIVGRSRSGHIMQHNALHPRTNPLLANAGRQGLAAAWL